ncbi:MAG TPA: hypothetical protein DIT03_03980 [Candidatus Accumulibacter sp.]|nr:hypothetical protein [Accumulibacter sp.]
MIAGDAGLCAAVLKTVNSPFFGLSRRVSSTVQAVNLLGMAATAQIVTRPWRSRPLSVVVGVKQK